MTVFLCCSKDYPQCTKSEDSMNHLPAGSLCGSQQPADTGQGRGPTLVKLFLQIDSESTSLILLQPNLTVLQLHKCSLWIPTSNTTPGSEYCFNEVSTQTFGILFFLHTCAMPVFWDKSRKGFIIWSWSQFNINQSVNCSQLTQVDAFLLQNGC